MVKRYRGMGVLNNSIAYIHTLIEAGALKVIFTDPKIVC